MLLSQMSKSCELGKEDAVALPTADPAFVIVVGDIVDGATQVCGVLALVQTKSHFWKTSPDLRPDAPRRPSPQEEDKEYLTAPLRP